MANLVRNPDSSNLYYVDPDQMPYELSGGTTDLKDDGTYRIIVNSTSTAYGGGMAATPLVDLGSSMMTFRIGVTSEYFDYGDVILIGFYSDGNAKPSERVDPDEYEEINGYTYSSRYDGVNWYTVRSNDSYRYITMFFTNMSGDAIYADDVKLFVGSIPSNVEYESAYMEAAQTVRYPVYHVYQNANGSWPYEVADETREGDAGSTVTLTDDDKTPKQTPTIGRYAYSSSRSTESAVLSDGTTTPLKAYFIIQIQPALEIYHQRADGSWPETADSVTNYVGGVQLPWQSIDTASISVELSNVDPTEEPPSGTYVLDESRSVSRIEPSGTDADANRFKAYFKLQFTVTYRDPSGTNASVIHDALDYGAATPEAPSWTRPGYVLNGWNVSIAPTVTQDVTYVAMWETESYTYAVRYFYQTADGEWPSSPNSTDMRQANRGDTVYPTEDDKKPTISPTSGEYVLDSSMSDDSLVVNIPGVTLDLYFKLAFTVTYTDGVSSAVVFQDQTTPGLDYGADTPAFSGTPTRTGYSFTGWTPEPAVTVTESATYTATWQIRQCSYQVRYWYQVTGTYDEGTAIVETSETRSANYGYTVQATEQDKQTTKPGYVLDAAYPVNGVTLTDPDGMAYIDVRFKQQFTVTYTDGAGGEAFADVVHGGIGYGEYTPTYDGTPQREGFTFTGWSPTFAQTVTADATYTAQWEALVDVWPYRVEYYYESGGKYPATASSYDTRTAPETQGTVSVTDADKRPTRPGYEYDAEADNVESAALKESGTVLKLHFRQVFTVTYTDGASGAAFEDQVTDGLGYGDATPHFSGTPEWYGHDFVGWSPSVSPTVTQDVTYTAQWDREQATYAVERYLQSEGSYPAQASSTTQRMGYVGDTVSLTGSDKTPPQGYTYDDDAANVESAVLQPSGTVLRAHFAQTFQVTYTDGASGEVVFPDQTTRNLEYGSRTPDFTGSTTRPGFTFAGWSPGVAATVTKSVTYTATWREAPKPILTIGGRALADMGLCVASRSTGAPKKKTSTVTVPHMSGFWDFSKVTGELAYESREVTYRIELLDDRDDLQEVKSELMGWLLEVHDEDIYDDDVPGWHFHGSCSSCEWEESDDGEFGAVSVTFLCQPFLISDDVTTETVEVGGQVVSNPGRTAEVTAQTQGGTATITIGGLQQSVTSDPARLVARLAPGDNEIKVTGEAVTLTWRETRL